MNTINTFLDNANLQRSFFTGLGVGIDGSWGAQVSYLNPDSTREIESYDGLGTVPQMTEWNGELGADELKKYSWTITNQEYASAIRLFKQDLRRDKTGQIQDRVNALGVRAGTHWESLVSTLLLNGEATACYDSQFFFDTDHAESGSNQTNDLGATEVPSSNVATATAPTPDEAANILTEMVGHAYTITDDQGEPFNADARNWTIMVGTSQLFAGFAQALSSENLSSGASNGLMGVVSGLNLNLNIILNSRLSASTTKVYMLASGMGVQSPFILQEEKPLEFGINEADINDRSKKYVRAIVDGTRAAGYGDWKRAFLCTLT